MKMFCATVLILGSSAAFASSGYDYNAWENLCRSSVIYQVGKVVPSTGFFTEFTEVKRVSGYLNRWELLITSKSLYGNESYRSHYTVNFATDQNCELKNIAVDFYMK
jgi:hypothetical protein